MNVVSPPAGHTPRRTGMVRPVIRVPAYEADEGVGPVSFGASDSACCGSGRKPFSKVPSLLFDLEDLEDAAAHKPCTDAPADAALNRVLNSLNSLLEPWSEAEYMVRGRAGLASHLAATSPQAWCGCRIGCLSGRSRLTGQWEG